MHDSAGKTIDTGSYQGRLVAAAERPSCSLCGETGDPNRDAKISNECNTEV